jgi:DNA-binding transcriptional LysR family regulator
MELRHLRYFVVLAEELHFGRAALRLSITQPPLSFAIQSLEKELDARLFERDNKQVSLTAAGAAYLAEVRPILDRIGQANDSARLVAAGKLGRLEIGFTGSTVYRDVPQIVSRFFTEHPGIEIALHELSSAEQIDKLRHGQLHAAFVNAPSVPEGLAGCALREDAFVCCLPEQHPLAGKRDIDLRELAGERFIMFVREFSPANYDNVVAMCRQAGFEPKTHYAIRQWLTIVALVANGLGVSLVPASIRRSGIAGARFVEISNQQKPPRAYLLWHPDRVAPARHHFLETAAHILGNAASMQNSPSQER